MMGDLYGRSLRRLGNLTRVRVMGDDIYTYVYIYTYTYVYIRPECNYDCRTTSGLVFISHFCRFCFQIESAEAKRRVIR